MYLALMALFVFIRGIASSSKTVDTKQSYVVSEFAALDTHTSQTLSLHSMKLNAKTIKSVWSWEQ